MLHDFGGKPNRMTLLATRKFAKLLIPAILGSNRQKKEIALAADAATEQAELPNVSVSTRATRVP
jgi:hypothetical protein